MLGVSKWLFLMSIVSLVILQSLGQRQHVESPQGEKRIYEGADDRQGAKLPSNRQVLAVHSFNIREVKLTVSESANLVVRECIIFWKKARILTKAIPNCVKKLVDLHHAWRELQKISKKAQDDYKRREEDFQMNLDNLFDIAHADPLERMKIEEDKIFLERQKEPGRPGCLAGVDKKLAVKEERASQRKLTEMKRLEQVCSKSLSSCVTTKDFIQIQEYHDQTTCCDESREDSTLSTSQLPLYEVSDNARIRMMPSTQLRQLSEEPFEFSDLPRSDDSEWDQLVKFASRKVEKFIKSTGLELDFNNEVTEEGRYSPRFVDEIVDEIDLIEDKKDTIFKRKQLKKLFIPLLLVLKIFKLKLLLFLPLILGLASFKKFLGFLAIIVPGLIAFFKFCKPDIHSNFGNSGNYYPGPHYSPAGIAFQPHFKERPSDYSDSPTFFGSHHSGGVNFRDDNHAQQLAYNGWNQYRSSGKNIEADTETSSKKSILPDS